MEALREDLEAVGVSVTLLHPMKNGNPRSFLLLMRSWEIGRREQRREVVFLLVSEHLQARFQKLAIVLQSVANLLVVLTKMLERLKRRD